MNVSHELQLELEPGDIVNTESALLEVECVLLVNVSLYYWCCLLCSLLHYSVYIASDTGVDKFFNVDPHFQMFLSCCH